MFAYGVVRRPAASAALLFWPALLLFAALYPGYSHYNRAISSLGAFGAPHALIWNLLGFIVPGLLLAISGARIALAIDGRRTIAFWLLVASGLGFAGSGVFPAEMAHGVPVMESPWTAGHIVMITVSGLPWLVTALLLVQRIKSSAWRGRRAAVVSIAVLAVVTFSCNLFADLVPMLADANGLAQRVSFAGYFAWFVLAESLFVSPEVRVHRGPVSS